MCVYIQTTTSEKEAINLKGSKEMYIGGLGGRNDLIYYNRKNIRSN